MKKVYIAGHQGMVGSAIERILKHEPNIDIICASRKSLDLTDQHAVSAFFKENMIDEVYLAAAKVGGIHANNSAPAEFLYQNLMIQSNIIDAAHSSDINKLLFLGSSCIYPKYADQPIVEDSLLTGKLESTNEPYAIAKIAGIKLCESYNRQYGRDYRSVMPTNLYGPNDNFHDENSHVIPALIRRFHNAKVNNAEVVNAWGTGSPKREFLHVDDMASACVYIMNLDKGIFWQDNDMMNSHINVGTGIDCTIKNLTETIAEIVGYKGKIQWDVTKPDGTPRKLLDVTRLNRLGWNSKIALEDGLSQTYEWFKNNIHNYRSS